MKNNSASGLITDEDFIIKLLHGAHLAHGCEPIPDALEKYTLCARKVKEIKISKVYFKEKNP